MPYAPPARCDCGGLIRQGKCDKCGPRRGREHVKAEWNYLYQKQRWRKASKLFRTNNPLCRYCERAGRVKAAAVVDHIEPHKGNLDLFWNEENWQSLCAKCHNEKSSKE